MTILPHGPILQHYSSLGFEICIVAVQTEQYSCLKTAVMSTEERDSNVTGSEI